MANTIQNLVFRLIKGTPLTPQEGDQNLSIIQKFVDALAAAYAAAFNPDGSLKDGSISKLSQFAALQPFADSFDTALTLPTDTGVVNTYTVADANVTATSYTPGMRIQFKALLANTGAATLNYKAIGATAIVKGVNQPLVANDILAGQLVVVVYDGANFQLIATAVVPATATVLGPVTLALAADVQAGIDATKAVTPASLTASGVSFTSGPQPLIVGVIANIPHGLLATPRRNRWVLVNLIAEGAYAAGDEVDVSGLNGNQAPSFNWGANATNVFLTGSSTFASYKMNRKDTGIAFNITLTSWSAKCYASLLA